MDRFQILQTERTMSRKLVVAAIRLGRTQISCSFSHGHDPTNVGFIRLSDSIDSQVPWSVVLDTEGRVLSLGLTAEEMSQDYEEDNDLSGYYLVKKVSAQLQETDARRDTYLVDTKGRRHQALYILSQTIKFIAEKCRTNMKVGSGPIEEDILWLFPVPQCWLGDGKDDLLRAAATEAGIKTHDMAIVSEQAALASLTEMEPSIEWQKRNVAIATKQGARFVVVSVERESIEATLYERLGEGGVKKLMENNSYTGHAPILDLQAAFNQFLIEIFGAEAFMALQEDKHDLGDLQRELEMKLRTVSKDDHGIINVRFPNLLMEKFEEVTKESIGDALRHSCFRDTVSYYHDKLRIDADVFRGIMRPGIDKLVQYLKSLFSIPGFAEEKVFLMAGDALTPRLVQEAIVRGLPDKQIVIQDDLGLAAVKGAAILGHKIISNMLK